MQLRRTTLLVLTLLFACQPDDITVGAQEAAVTTPRDVYLFMGQSNTTGSGKASELPPELTWYATPDPSIPYASEVNCPKDWSGGPCATSTDWEALGPRGNKFGPELSGGHRLKERFGDVAVIKHATNASSLYDNWDTTDLRYGLWTYATDYIDERLAEDGGVVRGLVWVQGESDANNIIGASDYAENLAFFILRLRQRYGCFPVVLSRVHAAGVYPYVNEVREEQEVVSELVEDVVLFTTDDLQLKSDGLHYTTTSFIELGIRAADAMPEGCDGV